LYKVDVKDFGKFLKIKIDWPTHYCWEVKQPVTKPF